MLSIIASVTSSSLMQLSPRTTAQNASCCTGSSSTGSTAHIMATSGSMSGVREKSMACSSGTKSKMPERRIRLAGSGRVRPSTVSMVSAPVSRVLILVRSKLSWQVAHNRMRSMAPELPVGAALGLPWASMAPTNPEATDAPGPPGGPETPGPPGLPPGLLASPS